MKIARRLNRRLSRMRLAPIGKESDGKELMNITQNYLGTRNQTRGELR